MSPARKYLILGVGLLVLLVAVQGGASLLVRTHRMRGYLTGHLQEAFGRPVEVERFSVQVLPIPELDAEGVTIGEDPSFGNEYFLRAENMGAGLRWTGLLRGHFEFGTMSFRRPSLILVRNQDGHWNLERWLPPARPVAGQNPSARGSQPKAESTYHLRKIDFDEGRVSFKLGNEKRPFAFTNVSGSVEENSSGRWQLQLEAQPWRSGVPLQSTGTLQVSGFVAGTSARLQPAQLQLHWGQVSLADLFRLMTGNDSGVRGEFALDGNASIGAGTPESPTSVWRFVLKTRAMQIHRWDLTERDDNPRVNVNLNGVWDVAAGEARAEEVRVELPGSQLTGSAQVRTSVPTDWQAHFQTIAVQGTDLLAWYRAFQPNVAEEVAVSDLITGSVNVSGWPLKWEDGAIEGAEGSLRIAENIAAQIEPFRGSIRNDHFSIEMLRFELPPASSQKEANPKPEKVAVKGRAGSNTIDTSLTQDLSTQQGNLRLNFHITDPAPVFKLAEAFGYPLNKGWEYQGAVNGSLGWTWNRCCNQGHRNGALELTKGELHIAGLNEPLKVEDARLEWKDGLRAAEINKADAFGAAWSGIVAEEAANALGQAPSWRFALHADHVDATELDRWIGPRARPNWLQRLLPSLLLDSTAHASELLRRVSAQGDLSADVLTVEKIKLTKAHAKITVRNLRLEAHNIEAQWGGGSVQGDLQASFSPVPKYEVNAQVANVSLAQLPWNARWAERWSGLASGELRLTTSGVGRAILLKQLAGRGNLKLSKIEFRGWDVQQSAELGGPAAGASHWTSGEGTFVLSNQTVQLDGFRLDGNHQRTQLAGTISFGMDGNLTFTPSPRAAGERSTYQARALRVSGQLENPAVEVQPATMEEARP